MKFKRFILLFLIMFFSANPVIAEVNSTVSINNLIEIAKTLNLSFNSSQLLSFDEKILRYKVIKEKALAVEIIDGIMNNRQELLIVPKTNTPNTLIVWTQTRMYLFNIQFDKDNTSAVKLEIPGVEEFNLDLPPTIKKSEGLVKLRELP